MTLKIKRNLQPLRIETIVIDRHLLIDHLFAELITEETPLFLN